ncbi:endonuclease domain-containing protein [Nonlabens marinus]|uniref:DUF559 domain-containing protein n=1 Tax=Nonlabens marinus S1-08 TaxID=1454201 RepID=W8VRN2_9FLAO|nr:endonuclease domain-containing protein [Nonlabens marinus]BAO56379.1 hypothetical protein NMS_2370 [Nonlabens marinus S1-08]
MKRRPQIHDLKHLEPFRKQLRKNLTPAEAYLWTYLQTGKLNGLKFRRQHSIKNYIVDFYCAKHKLVIELDGNRHNEPVQKEKDNNRDSDVAALGISILRYENEYVFEKSPHILNVIKKHCGID